MKETIYREITVYACREIEYATEEERSEKVGNFEDEFAHDLNYSCQEQERRREYQAFVYVDDVREGSPDVW